MNTLKLEGKDISYCSSHYELYRYLTCYDYGKTGKWIQNALYKTYKGKIKDYRLTYWDLMSLYTGGKVYVLPCMGKVHLLPCFLDDIKKCSVEIHSEVDGILKKDTFMIGKKADSDVESVVAISIVVQRFIQNIESICK